MNARVLLVCMCLVLAVAQAAKLKKVSTSSTTVYWTGGIPRCSNCGTGGAYACSTTPAIGQWNGGTQTFRDPYLPNSDSAQATAIVTGVSAVVYGAWSCSNAANTLLRLSVSGTIIDVQQVYDSNLCRCNTCSTPATFTNNIFTGGLPGYNYGGINNVTLTVVNGNSVCVNRVELTFTYSATVSETIVAMLPYKAYDSNSGCAICNYAGQYACTNNAYWGNGIVSFNDPLPKNSILLSVSARIYGAYQTASGNVTITPYLDGLTLGSVTVNITQSQSYSCDACQGGVNLISEYFYQTGWPKYRYGTSNQFQLVLSSHGGCVSFVQLFMEYYSN